MSEIVPGLPLKCSQKREDFEAQNGRTAVLDAPTGARGESAPWMARIHVALKI